MLAYLNDLPNEYEEMLNHGIMTKAFDKPLEEFIFDAFKGFEILPNIKILGYEWVPDEDKYDVNDHVISIFTCLLPDILKFFIFFLSF